MPRSHDEDSLTVLGFSDMPSRATSAFQNTVRHILRERASDYTMWVAGHGADTTTLTTYLDALAVFPSHFDEWASNKNRATLMEAIPALRSLLPSLFSDRSAVKEPLQPIAPLPSAVSLIITLALQQYMMVKDLSSGQPDMRNTVSGYHSPTLEIAILYDMIKTPSVSFGRGLAGGINNDKYVL